jgi:hypothetical protein
MEVGGDRPVTFTCDTAEQNDYVIGCKRCLLKSKDCRFDEVASQPDLMICDCDPPDRD